MNEWALFWFASAHKIERSIHSPHLYHSIVAWSGRSRDLRIRKEPLISPVCHSIDLIDEPSECIASSSALKSILSLFKVPLGRKLNPSGQIKNRPPGPSLPAHPWLLRHRLYFVAFNAVMKPQRAVVVYQEKSLIIPIHPCKSCGMLAVMSLGELLLVRAYWWNISVWPLVSLEVIHRKDALRWFVFNAALKPLRAVVLH